MTLPSDFRALCAKILAYSLGEGEYNFSHLNSYDRDNAAFDAWEEIKAELKSALAQSQPLAMTDFRSLCARMADELDYLRQLLADDRREIHALAAEARAALAQTPADPAPPSLLTDLHRAARLALHALWGWNNHGEWVWPESALESLKRDTPEAIAALEAALAVPLEVALAQPPADGEVAKPSDEELTQFLFESFRGPIEFICDAEAEAHLMIRNHIKFARAALERWGAAQHQPIIKRLPDGSQVIEPQDRVLLVPQPQPVPVSERPWERQLDWCDPDGKCWWCPPGEPVYWQMAKSAIVYGGWVLPAHAILLPKEVE